MYNLSVGLRTTEINFDNIIFPLLLAYVETFPWKLLKTTQFKRNLFSMSLRSLYMPRLSHKPLYTLTLTQNQKIIPNVGPSF